MSKDFTVPNLTWSLFAQQRYSIEKLRRIKPKPKKKAQPQANPDVSNQSMQQDADTSQVSGVNQSQVQPDGDEVQDGGDEDQDQQEEEEQLDDAQDEEEDENAPKFEAFFPESVIHFKGN